MLLAFCMGSQMAVLMSEQRGSDSFVDGNSDSDETQSSLAWGFILIAKRACIASKNSMNFLPILILSVIVSRPCVGDECLAVHCCAVEDAAYSLTLHSRCLSSCLWSPRVYSRHSVMCHHIACWTLVKILASEAAPVRATLPLLWDSHA